MRQGLLRLPDVLDIEVVTTLGADVRAAVASDRLVVEAGDVARIDTAGIQLLCAAVIAAKARGIAIEWTAVSQPVRDAAQSLGVAELLGFAGAR